MFLAFQFSLGKLSGLSLLSSPKARDLDDQILETGSINERCHKNPCDTFGPKDFPKKEAKVFQKENILLESLDLAGSEGESLKVSQTKVFK